MPNYNEPVFTKAGFLLYTKATSGAGEPRLKFTKMSIGKGVLPQDVNPEDLTALIDPIRDIPITRVGVRGAGISEVTGSANNEGIIAATPIFEIGLWAEDTDGNDILYTYVYTQNAPGMLYPPESTIYFGEYTILTITGKIQHVTANIVQPAWADEIAYDGRNSELNAASVQEAIDRLAYEMRHRLIELSSRNVPLVGARVRYRIVDTVNPGDYGQNGIAAGIADLINRVGNLETGLNAVGNAMMGVAAIE